MKFRLLQSVFPNPARLAAGLLALCCLAAPAALFGSSLQGLNGSFKDLALADGGIVGVASDDSIQFSTNGGSDFSEVRPASDILQAIDASGSIVLAGGESGLLLRTDNLFANPVAWTEVNSGGSFGSITAIANDAAGTWLAVTDQPGDLLRSSDNGVTWSFIASAPTAQFNAVRYDPVSSNWFAVGDNGFGEGAAYYSTTGGQSWTPANLPSGAATLHGLAVDAMGNLLVVGEGLVLKSNDGGLSYAALDNAPSETLFDVVAVSHDEFVAVGAEGLLLSIQGNSAVLVQSALAGATTNESILALDGSALLSGITVVEAPTIDPNGGNFTDPVAVSLSVPTGTEVYYTTDGSAPGISSTLYTGDFVIDANTTLRAIAVDGAISSSSVTAVFNFDPPATALPALRITAIDAANFQVELPLSQSGRSYQLQTSEHLQSWFSLQAPLLGTGGTLSWDVPVDGSRRFYRVLISE